MTTTPLSTANPAYRPAIELYQEIFGDSDVSEVQDTVICFLWHFIDCSKDQVVPLAAVNGAFDVYRMSHFLFRLKKLAES